MAATLNVPRATKATAADAAIARDADVIVVVGVDAVTPKAGLRRSSSRGQRERAPSRRAPDSPPDGGHFTP